MSFLSDKEGKKITSDQISIYDDALSAKSVAFPFDMEGTPKKKVFFVKDGIACGPVYDRAAALKAGKRSTGHAVNPLQGDRGAFAMNIHVAPGKAKRSEMIKSVKKGILITRFHYINGLIDPRNSILTGMTRDGTFWIENGEIRHGIKNLRFTDNVMKAFSSVKAISKETSRIDSWWSAVGCMNCPTIHLGKFRFSGKTEH
jgi:predicted Zn-dependent protease